MLYCRGKKMEEEPPETFSLHKLLIFLAVKKKSMPPADNPRAFIQRHSKSSFQYDKHEEEGYKTQFEKTHDRNPLWN